MNRRSSTPLANTPRQMETRSAIAKTSGRRRPRRQRVSRLAFVKRNKPQQRVERGADSVHHSAHEQPKSIGSHFEESAARNRVPRLDRHDHHWPPILTYLYFANSGAGGHRRNEERTLDSAANSDFALLSLFDG